MKKEINIFRKLKKLLKKEENNYDKTQENNYDKSESVWSMISRQIDELEDKVREIECLEQKELVKQYSDRVNNLREKYREKAILEENTFTNHDFDEILNELFALKYELDEYLNGEGIIIDKKITNERYTRKLEKMTPESCEKSTEELWIETRKILEDMKKKCKKNPHLEFENLKKLIAKHVLRILMIQAKRGEEIDLPKAEEFCTKLELIDAIKDKLNEMAENEKNEESRKKLIKTAENLDEKRLKDFEIWKTLCGVEDVKIVGVKEIKRPKSNLLQIKYEGLGIEKLPWISVYTLGDINEDGEWVNVRIEYGRFPKDFKNENDRVLQIEINGVSEITKEQGLNRYSSLKEVILGEDVENIEEFAFMDCEKLEIVKSLNPKIDLFDIGEGAFRHCKNLSILKFKDNVYYPPKTNPIYSYRKRCGEEWDIDDYYAMDEYLKNLSFRRRFTEFLE